MEGEKKVILEEGGSDQHGLLQDVWSSVCMFEKYICGTISYHVCNDFRSTEMILKQIIQEIDLLLSELNVHN